MPKMIILRGLPASGKTTWRKEKIAEMKNLGIDISFVSKDELRELYPLDNEKEIHEECINLIKLFISHRDNIIIDNTNLNQRTVNQYTQLAYDAGYEWEIKEFNTPLMECIRRNWQRDRKVPDSVIIRMAMDAGLYKEEKTDAYVFDLDGTLCDITHRLHFVKDLPEGQKKDWDSFFAALSDDVPNKAVAHIYRLIMIMLSEADNGEKIIFVSGRPERYRKETEAWLETWGFNHHYALFMRPDGDKRDDNLVKEKILNKYLKPHFNIIFSVDDRPSVCRMWRANNITCFQVNDVEF